MSDISTKAPKHCAKRGLNIQGFYKKLALICSALFLSVAFLVFLIWVVLHPSKPQFYLKETDIYQLNLSANHLLDSSIQVTFVSKNPNQKIGVYYDQLQAYASYKGQQITAHALLPPFYQGHEDTNILTVWLAGNLVPVAPSFGDEVSRDQTSGKLLLNLRLNGRLRWKVGTWVSSHYHVNVECDTVIVFGPNSQANAMISGTQGSECSSTV